jgi:hypothetical protein
LNVVGKKGDKTYNGFAYDQGSNNTASIDLFNYAPPLAPPPAPPPDPDPDPNPRLQLVVAAGNDYLGETEFLIVENASGLLEVFEPYRWAIEEFGFDVSIVSITDNTLRLSFPLSLVGLNPGDTITVELYFDAPD